MKIGKNEEWNSGSTEVQAELPLLQRMPWNFATLSLKTEFHLIFFLKKKKVQINGASVKLYFYKKFLPK